MLGQLQDAGNTTTLASYLRLLESAFLVSGLELFSKGQVRKRGSSPKLILWNNALINAVSPKSFQKTLHTQSLWGRLTENAVGAHFCNGLSGTSSVPAYWREGDNEVDFVVTTGTDIWAVEVKSGRSGKIPGMERFRARYPQSKALVIGGNGIPLEKFFSEPAEAWLRG
jgi:predicted AAA+ superfamily ATPase